MRMLDLSWPCLYETVFWKPSKMYSSNLSPYIVTGLCQWPRGLRHISAALTRWNCGFESCRGAWISVCCEWWLLSCRELCDGPIPRPEESYRVCMCVSVSVSVIKWNSDPLDLQWVGRKWSRLRERKKRKEIILTIGHPMFIYELWNFNSGTYLFTTDTK